MDAAILSWLVSCDEAGVWQLQDKFRLEVDDESAEDYFRKLIYESVNAVWPVVFEFAHKIRVSMRT